MELTDRVMRELSGTIDVFYVFLMILELGPLSEMCLNEPGIMVHIFNPRDLEMKRR